MLCMDEKVLEHSRLIENMIRFGTVAEVKEDLVRIQVGKATGNWIRWIAIRAGTTRAWQAPSLGEQAIVLSPGGDTITGIAILGIYSDEFPAPSFSPSLHTVHYPDGAVIEYDDATHALNAVLPGGSTATLTATTVTVNADEVTSNAPKTKCTGDLDVAGTLTVAGSSQLNGGVNAKAGAGGGKAVKIEGEVEATGDVTAGGISLMRHPHGGVQRGGSETDGPK